ncbi:helix-turn-helix transcriptional regulator [Pseudoalteromonas sp. Of11M-6]|uniref:helix-turn-helix domain-containing protein n=1 Tax=Pseudoalteromonas sp. Of11M-6 TaxID=2917754 RepID=UPI001EF4E5CE|nr:helix-turn-helix transcriptional regulator [Pseudoalteromonas sp. Of11M-6]MCG7555289.1 helix-turn-helix domain-containing protein [Pseudoalteromonas sp. Of11M-6]
MQTPEEYEVSQRIGLLIKGLKHKRGMSREDICRHLGIGMRTLDNYLNGVSSFKLGTLMKFADLCRVKLADILDDTEALSRLYPDNMKDKGSILTLLFGLGTTAMLFESVFLLLLIALLCYSYKDKNSQCMVAIFVTVYILTNVANYWLHFVLFPVVTNVFYQNIYAFSINLSLSLLLFILLKYRMKFAVFITRGKSEDVFEKNPIEAPLCFLAMMIALIDFCALMENFIRNLEHIGMDEDFAKTFWELTFFYDYYEYIKAPPILLSLVLLYAGILARKRNTQQPQST